MLKWVNHLGVGEVRREVQVVLAVVHAHGAAQIAALKPMDVKGNRVDVKGNSVDVKGNSVDVKGNSVDVCEPRLEQQRRRGGLCAPLLV
eukprot:4783705-Pyramimonas_sp.AAC.1